MMEFFDLLKRGWHGDAEGHSEAAKKGWQNGVRQLAGTALALGSLASFAHPAVRGLARFAAAQGALRTGGRKLAQTAYQRTVKTGGVTVTAFGKMPKTGFSVSPYKKREVRVPREAFGTSQVEDFIKHNKHLLSKPNHHLGAWVAQVRGRLYAFLDVSVVQSSKVKALDLARKNKQLAIYDLATGTEITLD